MMLTQDEIKYIIENESADTARLLLGSKPKGINVPLCVKCIEARKKMKIKAPHWHTFPSLLYPFSVSVEQGSSQATALVKQQIILELLGRENGSSTNDTNSVDKQAQTIGSSTNDTNSVDKTAQTIGSSTNDTNSVDKTEEILSGRRIKIADLTGGMGIDSYFISQIAQEHFYFERNKELCDATDYNFRQLGAKNIIVSNRDITADNCAVLEELRDKGISLLYIDPARRLADGKKAILLQDYEPNVVELQDKLFEISPLILVKVSPMADISLNLKLLPKTTEVHIITVDNECKELLFVMNRNHDGTPPSICVTFLYNTLKSNVLKNKNCKILPGSDFHTSDYQIIVQKDNATEKGNATYTSEVGKYLYEPNKGWLKAGAFNLVSERFKCDKLAVSTHLYTTDRLIEDFPGKTYIVEEVIPFNKKSLKELAKNFPKADISARNFPLDTNALKKLSGIKDGGTRHIFATTLHNGSKVLIIALPFCTTH